MQTVFIWVWYGETQDLTTWQLYVPLSHEKCLFSHTTKSHTTQLPYIAVQTQQECDMDWYQYISPTESYRADIFRNYLPR